MVGWCEEEGTGCYRKVEEPCLESRNGHRGAGPPPKVTCMMCREASMERAEGEAGF